MNASSVIPALLFFIFMAFILSIGILISDTNK